MQGGHSVLKRGSRSCTSSWPERQHPCQHEYTKSENWAIYEKRVSPGDCAGVDIGNNSHSPALLDSWIARQKNRNETMAPFINHLVSTLHRRQQQQDTSNQTSESSNLSGGAIAGIVIGSIIGFLLIVWIVRSCNNGFGVKSGPPPQPHYYHHEYDRNRGRSRRRHHSHHHHSPRRSGSGRPPVVVEKVYATPVTPSPTYAYQDRRASYGNGYAEYQPRSRSRRSSRY